MVKSGCQMCMSWTQVTSLFKPGDVILFIYHFFSFFFFLVTQPMSNLFYMPSASSNSIAGVDAAPSYWISATT